MKLRHLERDTKILKEANQAVVKINKAHNFNSTEWWGLFYVWQNAGIAILTGSQLKKTLDTRDSATGLSTLHQEDADDDMISITKQDKAKIFKYIDKHKGQLFSMKVYYFDDNYRIEFDSIKVATKGRFEKYLISIEDELDNVYHTAVDIGINDKSDNDILATQSDIDALLI